MMTNTDKIEKKIALRAPRSRVWRALTDSRQFGEWFSAKFEGSFAEGAHVRGMNTSKGYEHMVMDMWIDKVEPESRFAFRWHPYAIDPKVDYSKETPTLVEFVLSETKEGTLLVVTETGFDSVPLERRAKAFQMHGEGWGIQLQNIEKYLDAK